ncbi:unnamed protein product [Ilex paraguariensis]|uniref:Uncharacterized protein n=1 Tax=Ilex paraguariensis TaxID=185542 RepID=A0ABC8SXF3_9AQUA
MGRGRVARNFIGLVHDLTLREALGSVDPSPTPANPLEKEEEDDLVEDFASIAELVLWRHVSKKRKTVVEPSSGATEGLEEVEGVPKWISLFKRHAKGLK